MSVPKKRKLNDEEMISVLNDLSETDSVSEIDDSDNDSSESLESCDVSSDDDAIALPSDWSTQGRERDPFNVSGQSGVQFTVHNSEEPLEFFEKFFDDEVFEYLCTETNCFAKEYFNENAHNLPTNCRALKWFDTNAKELKVFVGLLILQGVTSQSTNSMYFSKQESTATPFYPKIMSGRRFDLLQNFLHLVDNSIITADMPQRKLTKVLPFIDLLLQKFKMNFIPDKNVCIDESLLDWKGNLSWMQYIPFKRKRFGIKFYVLCDSQTGYIWNFFIYTGKDTAYNQLYKDFPIVSKIVLTLMHELLDKGYCLYTDNFYTSPTLADVLADRLTDTVGTLRLNRKDVPKSVKEAKLEKGGIIAAYRKKSCIMKWKDKRDVTILSSTHDASMINVTSRRRVITKKPKAVADYNSHMGGVDLSDNLLAHFSTARSRMRKFYKKMFRHMLDIAVLNSFITYAKMGGKKKRLEFITTLGENIIASNAPDMPVPSTSGGRPARIHAKPSRLLGRHFPDYCPPSKNREKPIRNCAQCRKNNKRKGSSYWCKDCEVALCVVPCFRDWHST